MRIVLSGHTGGIGSAIYDRLTVRGHEVLGVSLPRYNVAEQSAVKRFWRTVEGPVDALINCAGKYGAIGPIEETNIFAWMDALNVNLLGTVMMCQCAIPHLREAEYPVIINFGGAGDKPLPNYSAYAASKSAVVRFTQCLAEELAPQVKVYALAPGFIASAFHEATLRAGLHAGWVFDYTRRELERGGNSVANVVETIEDMLSPTCREPSGHLITAQHRKVPA